MGALGFPHSPTEAARAFATPPEWSPSMPARLAAPILGRTAILAALLAPLALSAPAQAQMFGIGFYSYPRPLPPRGVYAVAPHEAPIPPGMAVAILGERGFRPVGPVALRGEALVVHALDPRGRPVTVVMDAYDGEILNVMRRAALAGEPHPSFIPEMARPGASAMGAPAPRASPPTPPSRPKELALGPKLAPPAPSPAKPVYPPPEASVLKNVTRPAQ
jgi:hypothetical protein